MIPGVVEKEGLEVEREGAEKAAPEAQAKRSGGMDPHVATEKLYGVYAAEFAVLDLVDGGRSLQPKMGLVTPARGMKLTLSPMETRHEKVLRASTTAISSLLIRVGELEAKLGIVRASGDPEDDTGEQASGAEGAGSGVAGESSVAEPGVSEETQAPAEGGKELDTEG